MGDATTDGTAGLVVIRSDQRFVSRRHGITTRHGFSFGDHYDPANISFGPLVAFNEEILGPGAGYAAHEHRELDIVTWVLEGVLRHEDSTGRQMTVTNGTVQRLTAGSGIHHSEVNAGGAGECLHVIQLWFGLGTEGAAVAPSYETWTFEDDADWHGFTAIAGGRGPRCGVTLTVPGVTVRVGHLEDGARVGYGGADHPPEAWQLYVAGGRVEVEAIGILDAGDTVRSTGPTRPALPLHSLGDSVLIVVELDEAPRSR